MAKKKKTLAEKAREILPPEELRRTQPNGSHMAPPGPHPGAGRPLVFKKQYRPEYCNDLVEHLKTGDSFECFGAYLGDKYGLEWAVGRDMLYSWLKQFPEFADARSIGEGYGRKFWEQMGKTGTSGQLRRLSSEIPIIVEGQPVIDPKSGKPVTKKEYTGASFGQNSWRMIMSSRFGLYDRTKQELTGESGGPIETTSLTPEEKLARAKAMAEKLNLTEEIE